MRRPTHRFAVAWLLTAATLLASCSGIPLVKREAADQARFQAYAGKPIASYTWMTSYDGWQPISDRQLVVWTNINEAYLITVYPPCTDLMFSNRIGLTSFANTVSAKFDFVKADGWKCMIKTIQPIDYRRMREDERKAKAAAAPRAASHTGD